jgi:hypothetical protein
VYCARCNGDGRDKPAIVCQSSVFLCHLKEAITAGGGLKAPRSYARPEEKKRNEQGRAAGVTGNDGIDIVKLGAPTAVVPSRRQRSGRIVSLVLSEPLRTRAM